MTDLFRNLPPLNSLVAFEAALRHKSFTRAADELALSQASVSRRIRELEQHLGFKLFERGRYDVSPTEEGKVFGATVKSALEEIARTTTSLRETHTGLTTLTVFSDISLAQTLITPTIGEFQSKHPDLQVRILASSESIDSIREEFDIGLQYGRWDESTFTITPLGDDLLFPVCSQELADKLPNPLTPVDVASQPLLHFSEPGRAWPSWRSFLANFRLKEPLPIEDLTFSSYQICLEVAEKGGGIALGWGNTVKSRIESGRLVRISEMSMVLPDAINLYQPNNSKLKPSATHFIEVLQKRLEENCEKQ